MSNCPLCRAPMREQTLSTSGNSIECFSGHRIATASVLPGVLPEIRGWLCWQTTSNSGVSAVRYDYLGANVLDDYDDDDRFAQLLIDRYESWMNHSSHNPLIEWKRNCAVPRKEIEKAIARQNRIIEAAITCRDVLREQLETHYPMEQTSV